MSEPEPTMLRYDEILLERLQVVSRKMVSGWILDDPPAVEVLTDMLYGDLLVQLRHEVLGERVGQFDHIVTFSAPASWWQHLKADHAPEWYLDRWPVVYRTERVTLHLDQLAMFPLTPIRLPPEHRGRLVVPHYRVTQTERRED